MHEADAERTLRILKWLDEASRHGGQIIDVDRRVEVFRLLASLYAQHGGLAQFHESAAEASRIADSSARPELQVKTYAELAQIHARYGDRERARQLVLQADLALALLPDGFELKTGCRSVSWAAGAVGNYELADRRAHPRSERDEIQFLLWRCQWYLTNGDAMLAEKAIAEASAAVDRFCTESKQSQYEKHRVLDGLLGVLLQANMVDSAEALAEQIDFSSLQARYLARRQWELGRKRSYQATISRQRSFVLSEADPRGNEHGPMEALQWIANIQREIGDHAGYAATLEEAERFAPKANKSPAWIRAAVYGKLAAIQHLGGDVDASHRTLRIARDAAEEQTSDPVSDDSIRCTVWLSVSDSEMKMSMFDAALQDAKRIPKRDTRIRQVSKVFARAKLDSDAAELVQAADSPDSAAELCLWIATHIALKN